VTKYVSSKDNAAFDETVRSAHLFQKQTVAVIPTYNPDYVINTDQTGCEYRIKIRRTLSSEGEKTTQVLVQDLNKITHSYTAQYDITASRKLLPRVFICLQERSAAFGQVCEKVEILSQTLGNVCVTATKSGKLQKQTYEHFLNSVVHAYVKKDKFLLIIDSWGGQTNPAIYNEEFLDENDEPTCTLKIIPPKCVSLVMCVFTDRLKIILESFIIAKF
jgi:hypothetical protein